MWRTLALFCAAMWAVHFVLLNGLVGARNWDAMLSQMPLRASNHVAGIGVSMLVVAIHAATARRKLWHRFVATLAAAMIACVVHAILSRYIALCLNVGSAQFDLRDFALLASERMWFYTSLSATVLALSFSVSLREHNNSLADMEAKVHGAELQALRYQLNPHFLFNTLNSIAALVGRRHHKGAESMIENLSDFLRAGLAIDPHEDVTLARELKLLALYLDIERQRYPGRIRVAMDVPEALESALVPSLVTQPLVESAVRRIAARSTVEVGLRIAASVRAGQLRLLIASEAGDARPADCPAADAAVAAAEERLYARFGETCSFRCGSGADGGYEVEFEIPLVHAAGTLPGAALQPARERALQ